MTQEVRGEKVDKKDTKKEEKVKEKKDGPATKVIIRHLPPSLTEELFCEHISPIPEHDYFHFYKADYSLGQYANTRAYISFANYEDVWLFREKFDGYVFVDNKGNEYPAIVELAPFQKVPKKKAKKVDLKKGTIEQDADYQKFLVLLAQPENDPLPTPEKYLEAIEAKERELKANHGKIKTTTPLLDYISRKKEEKRLAIQRARDDRRKREIDKRKQRDDEKRKRRDRDKFIKEKESDKESKDDVQFKLLKNPMRDKDGEKSPHNSKNWERRSSASDSKNHDKNRTDYGKNRTPTKEDAKKSYSKDRPRSVLAKEREREKQREKERGERENEPKKKKVPTATLR